MFLPSWFLKLASEIPNNPCTAISRLVFKSSYNRITRLSLFTKNKHFFFKSLHPTSYLLCRNTNWIVLFILLANRHRTDFSQHLYSSEKPWSPTMFYGYYSNSWAPIRRQRSCFFPKVWALLEMKGGNDRTGVPWHAHRLFLCLIELQTTTRQTRFDIYSNGFPVQFEVNRIFVFSVSPWLVLLVIL